MNNEQLEKANKLAKEIKDVKENIKLCEYMQSDNVEIRETQLTGYGRLDYIHVPASLYKKISLLILNENKHKLVELESEFSKLSLEISNDVNMRLSFMSTILKEALNASVSALYFADSSDYRNNHYSAVSALTGIKIDDLNDDLITSFFNELNPGCKRLKTKKQDEKRI